jgi:hypothetical protein
MLPPSFFGPEYIHAELEVHLRQHAQKVRVHNQLSGAHMIFPQEHGLALRVYYPVDLERLDKTAEAASNKNDDDQTKSGTSATSSPFPRDESDLDGILKFTMHFQWPVIFFVLPDVQRMMKDSLFVQCAMDAMDNNTECPSNNKHHPPLMMIVQDTEQVLISLFVLADSISPQRCALRQNFARRTRIACFCDPNPTDSEEIEHRMQVAANSQLAGSVRAFAKLTGADAKLLDGIPIEERSKRELLRFFSSSEDVPDPIDEEEIDASILSPPPFATRGTLNSITSAPSGGDLGGTNGFTEPTYPTIMAETNIPPSFYDSYEAPEEYDFGFPQPFSYQQYPLPDPQQQTYFPTENHQYHTITPLQHQQQFYAPPNHYHQSRSTTSFSSFQDPHGYPPARPPLMMQQRQPAPPPHLHHQQQLRRSMTPQVIPVGGMYSTPWGQTPGGGSTVAPRIGGASASLYGGGGSVAPADRRYSRFSQGNSVVQQFL